MTPEVAAIVYVVASVAAVALWLEQKLRRLLGLAPHGWVT